MDDSVPADAAVAGTEAFDGMWRNADCKGCPRFSLYMLDTGDQFQAFFYTSDKPIEQYCAWAIGTRSGMHLALKLNTHRGCARMRVLKDAMFEADLVNGEVRGHFSKPGVAALTFTRVVEPTFEDPPGSDEQVEVNVDSLQVGCLYTPRGGTGGYVPSKFGPELKCDRVAPTYVRAYLGRNGPAELFQHPNEQSCCAVNPSLKDGDRWERGPFACELHGAVLTCKRRDGAGFMLSATQMERLPSNALP